MSELRGNGVAGKVCGACGEWVELELLVKSKKYSTGRRALCKKCDAQRGSARYARKADEINARRRENYDPAAARESNKKYYEKNKEKFREYAKAAWESADKDAERERHAKWRAENPEKIRELWRRRDAKRRSTAKGKIDDAISRGISRSLARGEKSGRSSYELLGYERKELMSHLERHFQRGMTWENYGKDGWEIDHIIPKSAFNYQTVDDIDFRRCWALSNLQPMWATRNRSKRDTLIAPFQPSLALAVPANDNRKGSSEDAA